MENNLETENVWRIVAEECAKSEDVMCYARIQRRIILEISEKRMKPIVQEKYWDAFKRSTDCEMENVPYKAMVGASEAHLSVDAFENLLKLYEGCESMLQFMIDEYENAPLMIKVKLSKDFLMSAASYFGARKLTIREEFVLGNETSVCWHDILSFSEVFNWVRITAAGEEIHKEITDEYEEALVLARADPRFFRYTGEHK